MYWNFEFKKNHFGRMLTRKRFQKTQELEALRSDQDDLQTRLTAVSQEKSALQGNLMFELLI